MDGWTANARLIAAAPDLLEALQVCADEIEAALRPGECEAILELARSAITKALGQEHGTGEKP